jgi:hypothetical protein
MRRSSLDLGGPRPWATAIRWHTVGARIAGRRSCGPGVTDGRGRRGRRAHGADSSAGLRWQVSSSGPSRARCSASSSCRPGGTCGHRRHHTPPSRPAPTPPALRTGRRQSGWLLLVGSDRGAITPWPVPSGARWSALSSLEPTGVLGVPVALGRPAAAWRLPAPRRAPAGSEVVVAFRAEDLQLLGQVRQLYQPHAFLLFVAPDAAGAFAQRSLRIRPVTGTSPRCGA